jgi:hypothetical protein
LERADVDAAATQPQRHGELLRRSRSRPGVRRLSRHTAARVRRLSIIVGAFPWIAISVHPGGPPSTPRFTLGP